jgi:serine/threonine protein phosphatase PrpC
VRKVNEDAALFFSPSAEKGQMPALLIVADGIGGHQAGGIASQLAVTTILDSLSSFLQTRPCEANPSSTTPLSEVETLDSAKGQLRQAVERANQEIFQYAQENPTRASNLGTTLTCLLLWEDQMALAHVGDSRAYLLRQGQLIQLTEDHSLVGKLVREGQLPEEAYYSHPRRNVITRALGQLPFIQVDLLSDKIQVGDKLLLCSDGLWEMVRDPEIKNLLENEHPPEVTAQRLLDAALDYGGLDNIGVVIAEVYTSEQ